jgi:hypothetical protein
VRDLDGDGQPDLLVLATGYSDYDAGLGAIWVVSRAKLREALALPGYLRELRIPSSAALGFPPPDAPTFYDYAQPGTTTVVGDRLISAAQVAYKLANQRREEQLLFRTFDLAGAEPTRPIAACRITRDYPFVEPHFTDIVGVEDFDQDGRPDLVFWERGPHPVSKRMSGRVIVVFSPPCDPATAPQRGDPEAPQPE